MLGEVTADFLPFRANVATDRVFRGREICEQRDETVGAPRREQPRHCGTRYLDFSSIRASDNAFNHFSVAISGGRVFEEFDESVAVWFLRPLLRSICGLLVPGCGCVGLTASDVTTSTVDIEYDTKESS
jgi:hypothetical protein